MSTDSSHPQPPLRLAFVSSELAPLAQTGGLGDAVAGLARGLASLGHHVECILPAHRSTLDHPLCEEIAPAGHFELATSEGRVPGRWLTARMGPLMLHLADIDGLFDRGALYGGEDEGFRYVAFARAAAARCAQILPHVMVAHDWQAALSICILRTLHDRGQIRGVGTVQVVHNNAHQGCFPGELLSISGLPRELFVHVGLEFHGEISLLKGGLGWADRIVTVSPSYAKELLRPEFAHGLEGLYHFRLHRLTGIINGIDTELYDPAKDAALPVQYSARDPDGRALCRDRLLDELDLQAPANGRLLGCIGRLASQKGWDVLIDAIPGLIEDGASLALVGDGDSDIAARLAALARDWPGRVALRLGWDDGLARRLYAGCDALLVPSRFEPCGLVQLLAQRYGSLPIAHAVGGLRDTIRHGETGILFQPLNVGALREAVDRGAALRRLLGSSLVTALMQEDVSWHRPAKAWERELRDVAAQAAERL